ncbi:MAG: 16S rRNA (cytidine(1402)-2'-O)-methyltransferase [Lentisphaerae bacterium]|jgi:16S rRNA (cytidine1402-2'-O)-methyltransferase|nr:16S rRNA (cytidine(1402)-2'-O)-methyltransferase [Lentisphaerota bacterium]
MTLYLIATPIGNLGDMTPRAIETIKSLDVLFCEDTRHTGNLLSLLGIPRPPLVLSNHEHNERANAAKVVEFLDAGKIVGICSDAGLPILSDPGFPAVKAAIEAGHQVVPIPGACAATLALIASGLPASSFIFKGFPPRKSGNRRRFLEEDALSRHTLVFYESPFRIGKLLDEALEILGDRQAAVCLELTKQFERIQRGSLAELAPAFRDKKVKGEAVIVIEGNPKKDKPDEENGECGMMNDLSAALSDPSD